MKLNWLKLFVWLGAITFSLGSWYALWALMVMVRHLIYGH